MEEKVLERGAGGPPLLPRQSPLSASARRRDQRFTDMAVAARRQDAERFLSYGLWMLQGGIDCGADRDFLSDTARGLYDAMTNLINGMERDLDNAHLETSAAEIDRSELDALIRELNK